MSRLQHHLPVPVPPPPHTTTSPRAGMESVSRTCPVVVTAEAYGPCPPHTIYAGGGGGVRPRTAYTIGHTPFCWASQRPESRDRWWERRPVLAAAGREETFVADFDASGPFLLGSEQESRTAGRGRGRAHQAGGQGQEGGGGAAADQGQGGRPTRVRKLADLSRITPSGTCRGETLPHAVCLCGAVP